MRVRRSTDVTLLVATLLLVTVLVARTGDEPAGVEAAVITLLASLPRALQPLWEVLHDLLLVWAALLVLLSLVRGRWVLLRDIGLAMVLAAVGSAVTGRLVNGSWPELWTQLLEKGRPIEAPGVSLVLAVAIIGVTAPHLARPFRYAGRWLVLLGAMGYAALGALRPSHVVLALALGWTAAAAVHLLAGSPGGLPSLDQVKRMLQGIGVDASPRSVQSRRGVVWADAAQDDGTVLDVKVYGRDAWDGQLFVSLWHFLWYRDAGPTLSLTRLQQVEHEAFLTLLASRRGVRVADVAAAGLDPGGDGLLVTQRLGFGLDEIGVEVTEDELDATWTMLGVLHSAGIAHAGIEPSRVRIAPDGVGFSDFGQAQIAPTSNELDVDAAQLLVSTAVVVGPERAVASAARTIGEARLGAIASYVQPAALTVALRRRADAAGLDVDDVRNAAVTATGAPARDLQQLRRLSLGRVLMAALLLVASWAFVGSITDIGIDTIVESIKGASVPLLIVAFVLGFTPRIANAVALSAAAPTHIPLARLSALQLSITFVNLAIPSTAARAAVNIRFFQRSGIEPGAAVALGVLDSVTGFIGQMILIASILLLGLGSLHLDVQLDPSSGHLTSLLLVLFVVLLAGIGAVVLVPRLRRAVVGAVHKVWALVGPLLSSPRRLSKLLGANIVAELLFSLTMYVVLLAFGQTVGFFDVVLVNESVALFAGLMPVPGGIGVSEAALTAGFLAIGVDENTAFAAAITYRMVTYYLPPIPGAVAFRWLKQQRYL